MAMYPGNEFGLAEEDRSWKTWIWNPRTETSFT